MVWLDVLSRKAFGNLVPSVLGTLALDLVTLISEAATVGGDDLHGDFLLSFFLWG